MRKKSQDVVVGLTILQLRNKTLEIFSFYNGISRLRSQAQSTGEDSNSLSDNDEDISKDGLLNSVKTEPSDLLNDSMEHHRSTFPAALLGLQGKSLILARYTHNSTPTNNRIDNFFFVFDRKIQFVRRTDARSIRNSRGESGSKLW